MSDSLYTTPDKEYFERPCPACNQPIGITDAGCGIADLWVHGGCSGWLSNHIKKVREGFVPLDIDKLEQQIDDIICEVIDDSQMCIDYAGFSNQVDERKIAMEARSRLLALLGIKGEHE